MSSVNVVSTSMKSCVQKLNSTTASSGTASRAKAYRNGGEISRSARAPSVCLNSRSGMVCVVSPWGGWLGM